MNFFICQVEELIFWLVNTTRNIIFANFIRCHINKIKFGAISQYQVLSENFIREFQNKVSWRYISTNQLLSESFKEEFKEELRTL